MPDAPVTSDLATGGRHDVVAHVVCIAVLGLALGSYLWLMPPWPVQFSHDSAYIAIVARNLVERAALENDALWFLRSDPGRLPAPFENANPGYPVLVAIAASMTGEYVRAAIVVSITAMVISGSLLYRLLRRAGTPPWLACTGACSILLLPMPATVATAALPDAAWLTFILAAVLALTPPAAGPARAGLYAGVAWIVRSSSSLVFPAMILYVVLSHPTRRWVAAGRFVAGLAAPVVSWSAIKTWMGIRSFDASFLLQDFYAARDHAGDIYAYWYALAPVKSLGAALWSDGVAIGAYVLGSLPRYAYNALAGMAGWNRLTALALVLGSAALVHRVVRRREAASLCLLVHAGTVLAVFALRPESVEGRYLLGVAITFLGAMVAWPFVDAGQPGRTAALPGLLLAVTACATIGSTMRSNTKVDSRAVSTASACTRASHALLSGDRLASSLPFFCTFGSRVQSVGVPRGDAPRSYDFLRRYGVKLIVEGDAAVDGGDQAVGRVEPGSRCSEQTPLSGLTPVPEFLPACVWRVTNGEHTSLGRPSTAGSVGPPGA